MDDTTVYEYIKEKLESWDFNEDYLKETFEDDIRLIKTSILTTSRNMEPTIDEDYVVEKVRLKFTNNFNFTLDLYYVHNGGTPGCCATYRVTYTLKNDDDDEENDEE